MMKRLPIALTLLFVLLVFADAKPRPGDSDFFPIMGWDVGGEFQGTFTVEFFQEMADAGFNIAGIFGEPHWIRMIGQVDGLYCWAYMGNANQAWQAHVEDDAVYQEAVAKDLANYRDLPGIYGYFVTDEPTAVHFPYLAKAAREIKAQAPGAPWYLNLLPITVNPRDLQADSYADYVQRYIDACQPAWVGYDNYTLMDDGSLRADHWAQLKEFREVTLRNGLPFQACVLATAHMNYRIPSEDDLFFEVYGALLYGAKGIQYFNYWPPPRTNYRGGPVDQLGNKNPTWYHIKTVNASVHNLAPILNRLESTSVYHFQPGKPMAGEDPAPTDSLVKAPGDAKLALAVGEFRDTTNGDIYVMILNKDLKRSANLNNIQWRSAPTTIQVCSPYMAGAFLPGAPSSFYGEDAFVAPGHAILLRLTFEE